MSKIYENQEEAFLKDQILNQLSNETAISYVGCLHARESERQETFLQNCEKKSIPITVPSLGINLDLKVSKYTIINDDCDVSFESKMIFNGIAVKWIGKINKFSLLGKGHFELDKEESKNQSQHWKNVAFYNDKIQKIKNTIL
ncbi:Core binding factor, beta subunit family-containing protein [Strongyloides ratti]|uniref:Core binding factor, beta subunit family-containing protein n=1 Tax=Strongyloides ratti TaxID=34506 RepID=A0A090L712_STRRB|nr:Core binding factor, beta subunit family-containing protein [Strongyloides ratti]CEF65527.1 Core binding factor, beta subunit family-containing protein [Strongyloides ratti]